MRGRLVPFATMLLLFAMLPFLGGSAPQTPTASVVLAAGSPAVKDAVAAVGQAQGELSRSTAASAPTAALAPVDSAFSTAIGGGLFMFPAISLTPATAEAIAAPIVGRPLFIHPVAGGETSPFGPRIHPLLGRPMFHTGIDLAAACGTPIHAAADGTVIYARVSASWGGRTIIQHSPTVKTAYGHQSKFLVTEGQTVKQGQVIGLSGTTGWSTGCHLHFDVIINDRYVDPAPYLGFAPSATSSVPYAVVPHLVLDPGSRVIRTVADGDVPLTEATVATSSPSSTGGRPPSTSKPTGTPTTSRPTTSSPAPTTKPSPTSTKPSPTGSATTSTMPPTTTPPSTTTTTGSTGTTGTTTGTPSTTTTTTPPDTTTTSPAPATSDAPAASDPPSSTSAAAAAKPAASEPTATATATATAARVLKTATAVATAAETSTSTSTGTATSKPATSAAIEPTSSSTSEPSASSTTAAEGSP